MINNEELARKHSEWIAEYTKRIYYEAFLHGFKHGKQLEKEGKKNE